MYQTDFIMQTIRQFSEMLAALLFGARSEGETVAFSDLEALRLMFTGLSLDTLMTMHNTHLLSLFSMAGELDVTKTYASARLFHQLAQQERSVEAAALLNQKALVLLLAVHDQLGDYLNGEHQALTKALTSAGLLE